MASDPGPASTEPSGAGAKATDSPDGRRAVTVAVLVAALGYFVDLFDLILFTVLRKPSLAALEVDAVTWGRLIINWQLTGMLLGGIVWGVLTLPKKGTEPASATALAPVVAPGYSGLSFTGKF